MWMVALRVGSVWAALIAIYALCVYGMWPTNSSDWAAWVGAGATVLTVVWAVHQFRTERLVADKERAEARRALAWKQALSAMGPLTRAKFALELLAGSMTSAQHPTSGITIVTGVAHADINHYLADPEDDVGRHLQDPLAFGPQLGRAIIMFAGLRYMHNVVTRQKFDRMPHRVADLTFDAADVQRYCRLRDVASHLYVNFQRLTDDTPTFS